MQPSQVGLFAKYWQPGQVKTRLAATLGAEAACRVYRSFVDTLLGRLYGLADRHVLAFWPEAKRDEFARVAGACWSIQPQVEGNLGDRMAAHFEKAFRSGAERVVLMGTDSPTVPLHVVREALDQLSRCSVVLGPTEDGGYYLVGAAGGVPPIFSDIAWSTPDVWSQSMERIEAAGLSHHVLPAWYDVDEQDDLVRLNEELCGLGQVQYESLRTVVSDVLSQLKE